MAWMIAGCAFVSTWILLKLFINKAEQFGFVDTPNKRSIHTKPVPRGGGIVFGIVFFFCLSLIEPHYFSNHTSVLFAIAMIYIVGILDDHQDTTPRTKFIVLAIAILLSIYGHVIIDDVGAYAGVDIRLEWLALPFTLFALAGFTNAFNLIDGLDGLAASVGIVILSAIAWIGYIHNDQFIVHTAILVIMILLAFLTYNKPPAKVFMGDSGSLFTGFVIAVLATYTLQYISGAAILFLAAVPLLDTFFVMYRRKRDGRPLMQADRCHIHHILFRHFKGNIYKTIGVLLLLQIINALLGIYVVTHIDGILGLVLFGGIFVVTYRWMQHLLQKYGIVCYM